MANGSSVNSGITATCFGTTAPRRGDYVEELTCCSLKWQSCRHDQLMTWDKANLGIFSLRDNSLDEAASLEAPEVIAVSIIEDSQTALDEMSLIHAELATVE